MMVDSRSVACPVTRNLARFAVEARYETLPERVRSEAERACVNWMGCVIGGCREPPVLTALTTLARFAGPSQATIIGHERSLDGLTAAYINCMSSGVHTYDDTHL